MKRSINAINLLIITVIFLSGCVTSLSDSMTDSSATSSISSRTPKAIEETPNATSSSLAIQPSMTPTPEIHITPSASQPESASTVQPTVSPETTTTIEVMVRDDCPKLVTSETLPRLWTDGSVLFSTEQPGIWAISADNLSPQLVYEIPPEQGNWVILSTDGSKLARFERSNPEVLYEGTTVIYDLIAQEESRVPAPVDTWFQLWDWLPDGRIRYLTRIELTPNIGQVREFFLVNPSTMQTETVVEELNLPGFTFDERNIQLGFASLDPSKQLVLYTKSSERGDDVVLLDLQSNTVIWEQEGTVGGLFSEPRWAADGSRIVFGMPDPETTGDYIRVVP